MFPRPADLREEVRPMLRLATPVVIAELGWMAMGMVDTLMVGPLGPEAIGAVGLGSSLFFAVAIFPMGMLLGLDALVSQAFGAGRRDECRTWLVHGGLLALLMTVPATAGALLLVPALDYWEINAEVLPLLRPYLSTVAWSVLPLLLYFALRRYLQGIAIVRPIMVTLLLANLLNVVANWVLIFGKFGAPALGVAGAAWATIASRVFMAGVLLIVAWRATGGLRRADLSVQRQRLRRLVGLGTPAALQLGLEVGVFAIASALAGRMAPTALAAHQIALNLAGFTYMVPLGIASAGAVRVGHGIGRRDVAAAARSGWTAIGFGALFMSAAAIVFMVFPRQLLGAFTDDPGVLATGASLLAVAAVFQLFDGLQAVATGALRGLGDTRTAMLWNLAGHWCVGLPIAYVMAFRLGWGITGLWWGLSSGLIVCGAALLFFWRRRIAAAPALLSEPFRRSNA